MCHRTYSQRKIYPMYCNILLTLYYLLYVCVYSYGNVSKDRFASFFYEIKE